MIEVISQPTIYPVDLQDMKNYLRVDTNDDDDVIARLIRSATETCERWINKTLITKQYRYTSEYLYRETILYKGPIQQVDSATLYDKDGNSEALDISDVTILNKQSSGVVVKYDEWEYDILEPVYVEWIYTAGYGDTREDVPFDLTDNIMSYVAFLYYNRGGGEMPQTIKNAFNRNRAQIL